MRGLSRETGINLASLYDCVGNNQGILTLMYVDMMRFWRDDIQETVTVATSRKPSSLEVLDEYNMRSAPRDHLSVALPETWSRYRGLIRVLYREPFLPEEDVLKEVMASDSLLVEEIADAMKTVAGPAGRDEKWIAILANRSVCLLGLMSNRRWILKKFDLEPVLDATVDMLRGALNSQASCQGLRQEAQEGIVLQVKVAVREGKHRHQGLTNACQD